LPIWRIVNELTVKKLFKVRNNAMSNILLGNEHMWFEDYDYGCDLS